jgi:hypothetical protein
MTALFVCTLLSPFRHVERSETSMVGLGCQVAGWMFHFVQHDVLSPLPLGEGLR